MHKHTISFPVIPAAIQGWRILGLWIRVLWTQGPKSRGYEAGVMDPEVPDPGVGSSSFSSSYWKRVNFNLTSFRVKVWKWKSMAVQSFLGEILFIPHQPKLRNLS